MSHTICLLPMPRISGVYMGREKKIVESMLSLIGIHICDFPLRAESVGSLGTLVLLGEKGRDETAKQ